MYGNSCQNANTFDNPTDCQNFANGMATQGLTPLIFNMFILLRDVIESYETTKKTTGNLTAARNIALNSMELFEACTLIEYSFRHFY